MLKRARLKQNKVPLRVLYLVSVVTTIFSQQSPYVLRHMSKFEEGITGAVTRGILFEFIEES